MGIRMQFLNKVHGGIGSRSDLWCGSGSRQKRHGTGCRSRRKKKKIVLFGGLFLTDMSKNYTGLKNCYLNMENICPNFVLLYWIRFHLIWYVYGSGSSHYLWHGSGTQRKDAMHSLIPLPWLLFLFPPHLIRLLLLVVTSARLVEYRLNI